VVILLVLAGPVYFSDDPASGALHLRRLIAPNHGPEGAAGETVQRRQCCRRPFIF
jgi:hypothetical protein